MEPSPVATLDLPTTNISIKIYQSEIILREAQTLDSQMFYEILPAIGDQQATS